ncbi:hypothetical protein BGP75_20545 [Motiliproteus sp. MSK22-1]|nr:hypothetical protein BGP75_20545 [Motiliproteus sp. MSK22-1]
MPGERLDCIGLRLLALEAANLSPNLLSDKRRQGLLFKVVSTPAYMKLIQLLFRLDLCGCSTEVLQAC